MRRNSRFKLAVLALAGFAWQLPAFFLSFFLIVGLLGDKNGPGWLEQAPSFDEALGALALLVLPLAAGAALLAMMGRWATSEPYRGLTMALAVAAALLQPAVLLLLAFA